MTAIHYQLKAKPHTPTTIHVEDELLDQTIKRLESEGQWIQQFRKLIRGAKPDPKRYVVKEYRGRVLLSNLTLQEAREALIELKSKTRLVLSKASLIKSQNTEYVINRGILTRKRRALGLTKEALSIQAGMSQNYVSSMETKGCSPKLDTIRRLAAALGCKVEELIWERRK